MATAEVVVAAEATRVLRPDRCPKGLLSIRPIILSVAPSTCVPFAATERLVNITGCTGEINALMIGLARFGVWLRAMRK